MNNEGSKPGAVTTSASHQVYGTARDQKKAATRASLLEAACQVFMQGSVASTPVEDVARAAGVSKATLFFHFGTRTELLEAVAVALYDAGVEQVWHPAETGLATFLRIYLASNRTPEARLLWEIGDVLGAAGRRGPDLAYLHLISEIEGRLVNDGLDAEVRTWLARLVAPAALWVARRAAFAQADDEELERFVADVELTLRRDD